MGKSTINGPFSIAMLVYQRVLAWEEQQDPESAEKPMETTGDQEDERQSAAKQSDLSEAIKGWPSFQ